MPKVKIGTSTISDDKGHLISFHDILEEYSTTTNDEVDIKFSFDGMRKSLANHILRLQLNEPQFLIPLPL